MTHRGIRLIMPWGHCGAGVEEGKCSRLRAPNSDRTWEHLDHPIVLSICLQCPMPLLQTFSQQSRQDLRNPSIDAICMHVSSLEGKKIISRVSWKVKEESASIVIKAEMNDGFRGCGVDRLDDRGAEGPLQF